MPRRDRPFQAGKVYHLYNRGNNRDPIFFGRENYLHFLRLIRRYLIEETLDVLAYCLMPNHYHLLVHSRTDQVSSAMQKLSIAYTKAINKRYHRVGCLFQGQFQAIAVETDAYLLNLVRYIHLNPVKDRLVQQPQDWEFSSYLEYAGLRAGTLPQVELVRQHCTAKTDEPLFLTLAIDLADELLPTGFTTTLKTLMVEE